MEHTHTNPLLWSLRLLVQLPRGSTNDPSSERAAEEAEVDESGQPEAESEEIHRCLKEELRLTEDERYEKWLRHGQLAYKNPY